jgi:hypothetical protein
MSDSWAGQESSLDAQAIAWEFEEKWVTELISDFPQIAC